MTRGIIFTIDESGAGKVTLTMKGGDEVQAHTESDTKKVALGSRKEIREWVADELETFLKDRTALPEATPTLFDETGKVAAKKKARVVTMRAKKKK